MERYACFGDGAFLFARGFCDGLEGEHARGAMLLDASPFRAAMSDLDAAIEAARSAPDFVRALDGRLASAVLPIAEADTAPPSATRGHEWEPQILQLGNMAFQRCRLCSVLGQRRRITNRRVAWVTPAGEEHCVPVS